MNDEPLKPMGRSKMTWVLVALSPIPMSIVESWLASSYKPMLNLVGFTCVGVNLFTSGVGAYYLTRGMRGDFAARCYIGLLVAAAFYAANLIGGVAGCSMINGVNLH